MDIFDPLRKAMMIGLGVPEKIKEVVDDLIKKGEMSESQGAAFLKEFTEKAEKGTAELGKSINDMVKSALEKMHIPSIDEMEKLQKEVNSLSKKVKELEKKIEG